MAGKETIYRRPNDHSDEVRSLLTIMQHREVVGERMIRLGEELIRRGRVHDRSKLRADEFGGYVRINAAGSEHDYGSEGLNRVMREESGVIELHKSRNSHHPEHHHDGVHSMGLLDLIEMVADWFGAVEIYGGDIDESYIVMLKRFKFSDGQRWVIDRMIEIWKDDSKGDHSEEE